LTFERLAKIEAACAPPPTVEQRAEAERLMADLADLRAQLTAAIKLSGTE
jgi:hypothetical protein